MDFGLRGRTAIVCAASMGLGRSCAAALGGEGAKLVIVARRREILERAADEIRSATGAEAVAIAADVTTREGRDAILAVCPDPDILINNAGGPPPGDFRNWDRDTSRDAGITGFSHIGLNSTDPVRDERFWTQVCNARVSDRIGDIPLMRVNAIHHTIALVRARHAGIQHVNHQVETNDDVLRSFYFLSERRVPIVFGPGRHPTSGARFLYFTGPDGMVFEYSVGVDEIADEATHRPRQFGFEPTSFCMWGSKPAGMALPNDQ
jgi:catechol 2,3-dioxygenase-like lactoylglutathione lyase family enzyme